MFFSCLVYLYVSYINILLRRNNTLVLYMYLNCKICTTSTCISNFNRPIRSLDQFFFAQGHFVQICLNPYRSKLSMLLKFLNFEHLMNRFFVPLQFLPCSLECVVDLFKSVLLDTVVFTIELYLALNSFFSFISNPCCFVLIKI